MTRPRYNEKTRESSYWNEVLETTPREQLDALHLRRLRAVIAHVYQTIPMYREIYDRAGVKPEDIRTLDDYVEKLPTIDKDDVRKYQAEGKCTVLGSEQYRSFLFATSGTTGRALRAPGHFTDLLGGWVFQWWAHGIRPEDIFYFAFPFGAFMGFWGAYVDAILLGAQTISGGGVDSKARIRQILEHRPTVLVSTPTYALRLAEVAREIGIDCRSTSIRIITTGGETGAVMPSLCRAMEDAWGAKAIDLYGISEAWGCTSWQCPVRPERMHFTESQAYGIVVDDRGRVVPSGGKGEFILTGYEVAVQPLIKYRSHDVVEWHKEPCECGRTWLWLRGGVLGRTDQMVTIKGTNVYPSAIQTLLGEVAGLSEHLEIHIDREGNFNRVLVKVEPSPGIEEKRYRETKTQAENLLHARIGVGIPVEIVPPMSLPRYEMKAKLVFDHRPEAIR